MKALARGVAIVAVLAVLLAGAACAWFWQSAFSDRSAPAQQTHLVIERGASFAQIARQLAAAGVVDNVLAFRLLARLRGQESDVRAGEYRFDAHQTKDQVLRALVSGGSQIAVWVTVPEGFTAQQIAQRLQDAGVGAAAPFAHAFLHDSIAVGGSRTKNLEGFLFPSTYLVALGASPAQVEEQFTGEFLKQLPPGAAALARAQHVTVPQAVTVASLVEREAKADADRPLIAGVIYRRLQLGMPLEIDAAIEYALPAYKTALSYADLRVNSPYNTYAHTGLPPTPIANPGRPSLEAALRPSKTDDLYYVYCGNGRHAFAKTLAEHNANVARCLR